MKAVKPLAKGAVRAPEAGRLAKVKAVRRAGREGRKALSGRVYPVQGPRR